MQPILKIDLSVAGWQEFVVPQDWRQLFLGGASLAARLLASELSPSLAPLAEEAPLLFLTGPLTGTAGPAVGRFVVCGKGPATGLWAEANCGGFWGPALRSAGFDGLWITGRAKQPVYILIDDGQIEIRDASSLWGSETYEAQRQVKEQTGVKGARVAVIGPAGEAGVKFAGIYCDHGRAAGRTGLGAVMGSKNLKAVAVHGTRSIPIAHPIEFARLRSTSNRVLKQDNEARVLREVGTAGVADYSEYLGALPAKYFQQGAFDAIDNVSGSTMTDRFLVSRSACHACVIACGRVVDLGDGTRRKGPEYETVCSFGPNLLISDLPAVARLGELCDRLGMDTISAGNVVGLAIKLFEDGRVTVEDTGGVTLRWGDPDLVESLLRNMSSRTGLGASMAEGARSFARAFGAADEAVQVNGLEVAYHDPRGVSGMALSYATSPRGACHNQSDYFFVDWGHVEPEIGIGYFSRHAQAEKAANVARHQDWRTIFNSGVVCIFANLKPSELTNLINAATGTDWDIASMLLAGERGWNVKRLVNNRLGLRAQNDMLPKALLHPFTQGGSEGFVPDIQGMLYAYYAARGWDEKTGIPDAAKLHQLGIEDLGAGLIP
jgi:aldehyde:ferredoxin oxidoreductase